MQRLEVSGAVRPIYGTLGVKRLNHLRTVSSTSLRSGFRSRFYSLSVSFKRTSNLGSVLTNLLDRRIYQTKFPTHASLRFNRFSICRINFNFSFDAQTLM